MQCTLKMIRNMCESEHCALSALLTTHPPTPIFLLISLQFSDKFQLFNNFLAKKIGVGLSFIDLLFFKFVCSLPNFKIITLK